MLLQHGLHLHAHCTPQSLSVPVGIGIKGGRCLEALTSSCPTIFLATGTNRAVEVKLGSATRPYFLEEYILEWSNHMCNWTTSVFARVAAYDHLAISFGCGRWEVERRKLHPAPGQPIIVGFALMDKGFPLSSDNVCPRSVIPRASTPPHHWRKKKKKIKTFTEIRTLLCSGTGSSETIGSRKRWLMHEDDTSPKTSVNLRGLSSCQEVGCLCMAPLLQHKWVSYEQSSANSSLRSRGTLAQRPLMLSHTTNSS